MSDREIPRIFSDTIRTAKLKRAVRRGLAHSFLGKMLAGEIAERLAETREEFRSILFIGPLGALAGEIGPVRQAASSVQYCALSDLQIPGCETVEASEDRLPFAPDSFDLVLSGGSLDTVNDLPGALILIRRILKDDGLFLATLFGAGSLPRLRAAMLAGDGERAAQRVHPQIDVRSASALMQRAGFVSPIIDHHVQQVRYESMRQLVNDLRDWGATSSLYSQNPLRGRDALERAERHWHENADADGKVVESFGFIHLASRAPTSDFTASAS